MLKEVDDFLKKSDMSPEEFIKSVAKVYNIKNSFEESFIDYNSYYDSFTA